MLFYLDVVWFVDGQNHEILKPAISGFYIRFHPVYRPRFYLVFVLLSIFDIAINSVNPSFIWWLEFSKNGKLNISLYIRLFSIKKTSKVNTILKVVIFKNYVILYRCSMICRWPEPWNFKTSHFWILYSFPSRISALFLLHTKTYDAILLTAKVAKL
jgi:hypothetical protein